MTEPKLIISDDPAKPNRLEMDPCVYCNKSHSMPVYSLEMSIIAEDKEYHLAADCLDHKRHYLIRMAGGKAIARVVDQVNL